jgi:hypothetical protein
MNCGDVQFEDQCGRAGPVGDRCDSGPPTCGSPRSVVACRGATVASVAERSDPGRVRARHRHAPCRARRRASRGRWPLGGLDRGVGRPRCRRHHLRGPLCEQRHARAHRWSRHSGPTSCHGVEQHRDRQRAGGHRAPHRHAAQLVRQRHLDRDHHRGAERPVGVQTLDRCPADGITRARWRCRRCRRPPHLHGDRRRRGRGAHRLDRALVDSSAPAHGRGLARRPCADPVGPGPPPLATPARCSSARRCRARSGRSAPARTCARRPDPRDVVGRPADRHRSAARRGACVRDRCGHAVDVAGAHRLRPGPPGSGTHARSGRHRRHRGRPRCAAHPVRWARVHRARCGHHLPDAHVRVADRDGRCVLRHLALAVSARCARYGSCR